jgi:hypothetical protein
MRNLFFVGMAFVACTTGCVSVEKIGEKDYVYFQNGQMAIDFRTYDENGNRPKDREGIGYKIRTDASIENRARDLGDIIQFDNQTMDRLPDERFHKAAESDKNKDSE